MIVIRMLVYPSMKRRIDMTRTEAAAIFGGLANMARAVGIESQSLAGWPEQLTDRHIDRVLAAACMLDLEIPEHIKEEQRKRRAGWKSNTPPRKPF